MAEIGVTGLEIVPTGVAGLDVILGGGLPAAGAYLIAGIPGTGKTTLGNQLAFLHAAGGGSAVFATILAESHGRMLAHLRQFAFFDPALVGERVHYANLLESLDEGGLDGLLVETRRVVREHHASLLVIDGTTAAEDLAPSPLDYRRFTQALQVQATLLGCTTILLSHRRPEEVDAIATHVDGVVVLARERLDGQARRSAEVTKLRGVAHRTGGHDLAITGAGVAIYPRLESVVGNTEPLAPEPEDRLGFDVPGLDAMLAGGLPARSSTVVLGPTGTGKTTIALHFAAAGADQGEPVLFAGFRETEPSLNRTAAGLGLGLDRHIESGLARVLWQAPLDLSPDQWAWSLLDAVAAHRPRRVVVDALSDVVRFIAGRERMYGFAVALTNELQARGTTALFTIELDTLAPGDVGVPLPASSAAMDNGVLLRAVERQARLRRWVSVLKLRQSGFDPAIREFVIGDRGVEVGDTADEEYPEPPAGRARTGRSGT